MSRIGRILFIVLFGLGGAGVLLSLGLWQMDRLLWKQELIQKIAQRAEREPSPVSGEETQERDEHRAATASGRYVTEAGQLRYLTSFKGVGPGFRLIAPFELAGGERILVDRGFAPEAVAPRLGEPPAPPSGEQTLRGVLRWPNETSRFTPEPDTEARIWFARDVASMAEQLGTAPVLLVLTPPPQAAPTALSRISWPAPAPVTIDLPNNHLGYALTWFSLTAIWLAMTGVFAFRTRRQDNETALAR